jgi:retron-type reverse transcriptase
VNDLGPRFEVSDPAAPLIGFVFCRTRIMILASQENDVTIDLIAATVISVLIVVIFLWVGHLVTQRRNRKAARLSGTRPGVQRSQTPSSPIHPLNFGRDPVVRPSVTVPPSQPSIPRQPAPLPTLDLATFAPMSDAQIKAAAQGVNLFTNFSFGLRSQIPPVSDPRTLLIDKALVAHGLLTPEELLEIHKIGDAMDEAKPNLDLAVHRAEQAVARTLEEKKRLKEQKKAEAAERKRLHQEAVAHRKATDIFFLGRGVSKGLADRRSNSEKLTAANLPILSSPVDIATALNLTIPRLRWLAFHSEAATRSHYVRFTIPKRSGGHRHLFAPHKELAAAQEWILRNVLDKVPTHPAAHGFVKTRSTVTNAAPHVDQDLVLNADLTDFFPTITFPRVLGIFKQLGYSPAAATILALICTESPRRVAIYAGKTFHVATGPRTLPQGACTSPALSNLAARRLDSRLNGIATKLNYRYTRYADDLTFSFKHAGAECRELRDQSAARDSSSAAPNSPDSKIGYLLARLRHIAQDEGFAVNEKKTRILKRAARQEVTGVVVNKRPGVPRPLYKRLRAILHRAKHEGLAAQNRENLPHFEAWLKGMIAYVSMVNPKQGQTLADALAQIS